jgi:dolichyl-phosphate-mannose-protein mannosyltransferase
MQLATKAAGASVNSVFFDFRALSCGKVSMGGTGELFMTVFGSLPFIALLLIILLYARRGCDWPESILLGSTVWLLAISLLAEVISFENAIGFSSLAWAWGAGIIVLITLHASYPGSVKRARIAMADYSTAELISLLIVVIIFTTTLFVALLSPPNNWDSQTYHLPRIEHWIQDRSFTPYPTANQRQIAYPGFAETVVLQFRVLSASDRLDNLVQWLAALGSVVAVGKIAAHIGASRQGAIIASAFAASLPMMILESTNTKNDIVLSFLLLCVAERLLAWNETRSLRDAAYMAIAAGLALATKGTAYPIAAAFGVYFLVALARQPKRAIWCGLVCLSLLLLPNLGFYARNIAFLGSPFGSSGVYTNNADFGPGPLALNAIRNIAVNLASFDVTLNNWSTAAAVDLIRALGLDPNDPATTFPGTRFGLRTAQNSEDEAGNPIHLVLVAIAVAASLRSTSPPAQRRYGLTVLASAVLFLIVLRWQPWITRLQLPLFALAAPMVGCLSILQKRERFAIPLLAALALSALPALLMNNIRSLVPRPSQGIPSLLSRTPLQLRFANRPDLLIPYQEVARYVMANDHHDIGLLMGGSDWEYPLWRLLQRAEVKPLRIEHVFIAPSSTRQPDYPLGPFRPSLIIATVPNLPRVLVIDGVNWNRQVELPALSLYTPAH